MAKELKKVVTGRDIRDGSDVIKEIEVEIQKDHSEGRMLKKAHSSITGSVQGRKFDLKPGDEVYMNEDEALVFKAYVS